MKPMPDKKKIFIDTNIWLYAFIQNQENEAKSNIAKEVITSGDIFISTQVIGEICVNLIKKAGFKEEQISNLIISFFESYPVIEVDSEIMLSASQLRAKYNFSYWDSLIVACGLAANAEILYSEDMQNGLVVEEKIKIINPFAK